LKGSYHAVTDLQKVHSQYFFKQIVSAQKRRLRGSLQDFSEVMMRAPPPRGPGRYKSKFTADEDSALRDLVSSYGTSSWSAIAARMSHRNARQCRERWNNYLNPRLGRSPWTPAEDLLLHEKFAIFGSQWHEIARFFPSRSRNAILNHWKALQSRLSPATPPSMELQGAMARDCPASINTHKEGIQIGRFSLSTLVPIAILPRGHSWQT
jgi:hypothetical protein